MCYAFILDDLVLYLDMLGNLFFVTIAGVHHLFDNIRDDFQKFFETSILFTATLLFLLVKCFLKLYFLFLSHFLLFL